MIRLVRTTADNKDFTMLVVQLDADLKLRDGEDHVFYAKLNKLGSLTHTVVAYEYGEAVGCGAIRVYEQDVMEIKRMYVIPTQRKKGIATLILYELEKWAKELNCTHCVLETGDKQPEAVRLYYKSSYHVIENYGQYKNVANSICFKKVLV